MSSKTRISALPIALPCVSELLAWASAYERIALDLGAGDGRFARKQALAHPRTGVIAVDTCADSARPHLRRAPANMRFIVADACALPPELLERADKITINFPWGSLLRELLDADGALLPAMRRHPLTVRVNAGALAEAGYGYEAGVERMQANLRGAANWELRLRHLERDDLRHLPTTWAKRLAFGRDPRAIELDSTPQSMIGAAD